MSIAIHTGKDRLGKMASTVLAIEFSLIPYSGIFREMPVTFEIFCIFLVLFAMRNFGAFRNIPDFFEIDMQ